MEEPEYATVLMRVKLKKTVGELKAELAEQVDNIYFAGKKLVNDDDTLAGLGIVAESKISNSKQSIHEDTVKDVGGEKATKSPRKLFHGSLSVNNFVNLVFRIMTVFPMLKKVDLNSTHKMMSNSFRPALQNIMSQLDPVSFLRFSSTCRRIRTFALSKKNGVCVVFPCSITKDDFGVRFKWFKEGEGNRTIRVSRLKNITRFPFKMEISVIFRSIGLDNGGFNVVSQFIRSNLKSFTVFSIDNRSEWVNPSFEEWQEIASFLTTYQVGQLDYRNELSREVIELLISTKVDSLWISTLIPVDLFQRVMPKEIQLFDFSVSIDYFKELIQAMSMGLISNDSTWSLYSTLGAQVVFEECFAEFTAVDYDHEGALPLERPLAFYKINRFNHWYIAILTKENKVYGFTNRIHGCVMCGRLYKSERDELPAVLQAYLK